MNNYEAQASNCWSRKTLKGVAATVLEPDEKQRAGVGLHIAPNFRLGIGSCLLKLFHSFLRKCVSKQAVLISVCLLCNKEVNLLSIPQMLEL